MYFTIRTRSPERASTLDWLFNQRRIDYKSLASTIDTWIPYRAQPTRLVADNGSTLLFASRRKVDTVSSVHPLQPSRSLQAASTTHGYIASCNNFAQCTTSAAARFREGCQPPTLHYTQRPPESPMPASESSVMFIWSTSTIGVQWRHLQALE